MNAIHAIYTSLWLPISSVLILDDIEMLNLDQGDEVVMVTRIK